MRSSSALPTRSSRASICASSRRRRASRPRAGSAGSKLSRNRRSSSAAMRGAATSARSIDARLKGTPACSR
jgi:hypothetical protein